jgi:CheY-like chemotaxis protein
MSTILCIDDDPAILELEKSLLETKGHTVLIAPDGPAGLALAARYPIDLVVLDFKMPGMDGAEVAESLLKERPGLPIVVGTGFFDQVPEWLKWFAAAYLHKGDGPGVLLSAIEKLLAEQKVSGTAGEKPRSFSCAA